MYSTIQGVVEAQGTISVERMCQAAGVSRAGFYRDWERREPRQIETSLRDAVQQIAVENPRLGYRQVYHQLQRRGYVISEHTVRKLLRTDNLLAIRRRKFVVTTKSKHRFCVHPLLAAYTELTHVNQLWVADLTYVRLSGEFVYVAVVLDAFSRRAVGWAVGRKLTAALALEALDRAVLARQPPPYLIHHSDRGAQYASDAYVHRTEELNMVMSMSRPGRPWDNARCESFIKTLKAEQIDAVEYDSLEELQAQIDHFLANVYNRQRLHSALDYLTPAEFECIADARAGHLPAALSFPRYKEIFPDGSKRRRHGRMSRGAGLQLPACLDSSE